MTERKDLPDTADEMHVNQYGSTRDPAVVIEEPNRTVLLTNDETVVFEKQPRIDIAPADRPRKVYGGMWGNAEIGAVGISSLAVLAAILLYLFAVVPSNKDIEKNRQESSRLQDELTSAQKKYGNITSTESQVDVLLNSVNDFEMNNLPVATIGKNALYQRINSLITSYGLVNTTGPDYVALDAIDQNAGQQTDEERGRAKFRSLFPGVYVTMTLDGSYQNLRRFINDIERGDRGSNFVVVSAIELEPSDSESHQQTTQAGPNRLVSVRPNSPNVPDYNGMANPGAGRMTQYPGIPGQYPGIPMGPQQPRIQQPQVQLQQQQGAPRGKTHGETVSLRLELAAYFRRPNFVPIETPAPSATKGGAQ